MHELDSKTKANLEVVLESLCRGLSKAGGDHESRKFVAERLTAAARWGETSLAALESAGRGAIEELSQRRSA